VDHELRIGDRVLHYSRYGDPSGPPVVSLGGSPSTRWKRPDAVQAIEESGLCLLIPDRPGYGGSTRQPGRTVADAATDVQALADANNWDEIPHAELIPYTGGHTQPAPAYRDLLRWLSRSLDAWTQS